MLFFNLNHIFKLRGIDKPYSYLKSLGFSHMISTRLANNEADSMKAYMIEKICLDLNCTPNDLMEYQPDEEAKGDDVQLNSLIRHNEEDLKAMLKDIPLEKLDELKKFVDQLKDKDKKAE